MMKTKYYLCDENFGGFTLYKEENDILYFFDDAHSNAWYCSRHKRPDNMIKAGFQLKEVPKEELVLMDKFHNLEFSKNYR